MPFFFVTRKNRNVAASPSSRFSKVEGTEADCQLRAPQRHSDPCADAFFISLFSFLYYLLSIFNKKFSFSFSHFENYPSPFALSSFYGWKKGAKCVEGAGKARNISLLFA